MIGVVSYRNSTSNHNRRRHKRPNLCVVSYRNSTSNHNYRGNYFNSGWVVSYRNSTSNHNGDETSPLGAFVVSYRNSTSNHNLSWFQGSGTIVVSYRNSTSNHNSMSALVMRFRLYLIEILHQTTTRNVDHSVRLLLYLIEILHQTTTLGHSSILARCCILSKFYIKPQPRKSLTLWDIGCILSKFYIKPQHCSANVYNLFVVSYRNSTSNHNYDLCRYDFEVLYLIEILHQTTTKWHGKST